MRRRICIDKNWKFSHGDIHSANLSAFDDSGWDTVHLPHDSGIGLEFDSNQYFSGFYVGNHLEGRNDSFLPKLVCWYRKELEIGQLEEGNRVYLEFEGVFRDCQIWVNGRYAGNHVSGYTGVVFDITPFISTDSGPNTLAVRVDPRGTEGWWYEGSGIYRHVWLGITNAVHIDNWGTFVTTPTVDRAKAGVNIETDIKNTRCSATNVRLETDIIGPDDNVLFTLSDTAQIQADSTLKISQSGKVDSPRLWSLDDPALYRASSRLFVDGNQVDACDTTFGIRYFEFTADKGFFLNGEHVQFRGMCLHHDWGGVGTGVPDRLNEKTVEIMKEMGCTMLRSAHNPAAPSLMEACDRLGMLLLAETRNLYILNGARQDLRDLIRRDRNHPSIIGWSLANTAGSPDGLMTKYLSVLNDICHEEDPSRPSIVCLEGNTDANANEFAMVTDVVGYNGGGMGIDDRDHSLYPERKMFVSEFSSGRGARGVYVDMPPSSDEFEQLGDGRVFSRGGQYFTEFDLCRSHEREWTHIAKRPHLAGGVMWSGIEYRAETAGWPVVTSQFGVLDICRLRKDAYYYYLQEWTDKPMVHIFPHWTWPGREGDAIAVWCYSNCDSVELVLSGKSLGSKDTVELTHLEWEVPYAPGTLTAYGVKGGNRVCECSVQTAGQPAKVALEADRTALKADGVDVAVITATVTDAQGVIVPDASNLLTFAVEGQGRLVGVSSGDPASHENERLSSAHAFSGKCIAIVESAPQPGKLRVSINAEGLQGAGVEIDVKGD